MVVVVMHDLYDDGKTPISLTRSLYLSLDLYPYTHTGLNPSPSVLPMLLPGARSPTPSTPSPKPTTPSQKVALLLAHIGAITSVILTAKWAGGTGGGYLGGLDWADDVRRLVDR